MHSFQRVFELLVFPEVILLQGVFHVRLTFGLLLDSFPGDKLALFGHHLGRRWGFEKRLIIFLQVLFHGERIRVLHVIFKEIHFLLGNCFSRVHEVVYGNLLGFLQLIDVGIVIFIHFQALSLFLHFQNYVQRVYVIIL